MQREGFTQAMLQGDEAFVFILIFIVCPSASLSAHPPDCKLKLVDVVSKPSEGYQTFGQIHQVTH